MTEPRRSARGPNDRHTSRRLRTATTRRFLEAHSRDKTRRMIVGILVGGLGMLALAFGAKYVMENFGREEKPERTGPKVVNVTEEEVESPQKTKRAREKVTEARPEQPVEEKVEVTEKAPEKEPEPEPEPVDPLMAPLIERIVAASPVGKKFNTEDWGAVTITALDAAALTVDASGKTRVLRWALVPPEAFAELAMALEPPDPLAVARYCIEHGLRAQADRQLHAYWQKGPAAGKTARKSEIDAILAEARSEALPKSGYLWSDERGFEHPDARDARKVLDKATAMCSGVSGIARHSDGKRLLRELDTLSELAQDETHGEAIRAMAAQALHDHRALRIADLKSDALKSKVGNLSDVGKRLDTARREALKVIHDLKIYPDEDHGRVGQPAVDEAVGKVQAIWDATDYESLLPASLAREMQALRRLDDELFARFGTEATEAERAGLSELCVAIQLSIRKMVRDIGGKSVQAANDAATKYNRETFECPSGVPRDVIDQVEALNDYRHMLGLPKLRLDARLCRAAQFHTENMAAKGTIWHIGDDGTPSARAAKEGYGGGVSENCAAGCMTALDAHRGWYTSSGHHRNMIDRSHNAVGIGFRNGFWTQKFGSGGAIPK